MSRAEYKGVSRNAAALADIAETRDQTITDLKELLRGAVKAAWIVDAQGLRRCAFPACWKGEAPEYSWPHEKHPHRPGCPLADPRLKVLDD